MENLPKKENNIQKPVESIDQISKRVTQPELISETEKNLTEILNKTTQEIEVEKKIISDTNQKVHEIRQELGLPRQEVLIPSNESHEKMIINLENRKAELEYRLNIILQSDNSEKYISEIEKIRESKIDWAKSNEFARRLKLRGATDDDVAQLKNWVMDNTVNTKSFVLSPEKIQDIKDVLQEMTGQENIQLGRAFHIPGGIDGVPDNIKNSVFLVEKPAAPNFPGQKEESKPSIDLTSLSHEFGHAAQDGLLESELYNDWNPNFKDTAPDKEYVGLINETDTRIRSMYNELSDIFDPHTEVFGKKHLLVIREKIKTGRISKDTRDLIDHYSDINLIKMANRMPAI